MEILKVSARSRSTAVAGAIAGVVRESGRAEVQAIGAGAVNQAVKAVAIARGYLALDGIDVICIPAFTEVTISGPGELSLVRRSHIGFTGGELVMLCRWIENPGFPLRWEKPPPWQRVRGTNAPSAGTNRPASSTGAKSAPKPQAKPANPVGTPAGQPRQGK